MQVFDKRGWSGNEKDVNNNIPFNNNNKKASQNHLRGF